MLRQHLAAHLELAQPEPRDDDGNCHHGDEPEGCRADDGVAECLVDLLVVVREKDDLAPYQRQGAPAEKPMCAFKGIVVRASGFRICEDDHAKKESEDDICENERREGSLGQT